MIVVGVLVVVVVLVCCNWWYVVTDIKLSLKCIIWKIPRDRIQCVHCLITLWGKLLHTCVDEITEFVSTIFIWAWCAVLMHLQKFHTAVNHFCSHATPIATITPAVQPHINALRACVNQCSGYKSIIYMSGVYHWLCEGCSMCQDV